MSIPTIIESASSQLSTAAVSTGGDQLPTAAWDVVSFLDNAKSYVGVIGGSLVGLVGIVLVVWAAVLIGKKFFGSQGQGDSWVKIVLMIIIGGAMLGGGLVLLTSIAEGGKTTIEELGGGAIFLQSFFGLGG